ncbi:hydroxymethylglutaryl-CoA lyase [Pseudonocardia kujensis]|uniref:hydroxymethylglutaryl-CoA lyase n=1 Tax=Pseudonocardia kujensis TaxID=1128675 RepID=UPI001E33048C|nr:hydroxymethylglutaryl-CoA lyase [Pseudonocardia kujensis]MCE0762046.1 hydroxymethylglutaryl-CoA lyase [Pseudonocardia kujensis]
MLGIVEVGPRDGLQNERALLDTDAKVELIRLALAAGARRIEAVSFVRPDAVPAMADAEAVMERVPRSPGVSFIGLVLNPRGYRRAVAAGIDEVNVVVPASDGFAKANQNSTTAALTAVAEEVVAEASTAGLFTTVTVATAFGCPFDGEVDPARVFAIAERAARAGAREIAVADTIGVGVPTQVRELLEGVRSAAPGVATRAHFHNTRNTGYANAVTAYEWGVGSLDSSFGGIGGCPFAPNATGNIATEDLVALLDRMGVDTGLDLGALLPIADLLSELLDYRVPALLPRAGAFGGARRT